MPIDYSLLLIATTAALRGLGAGAILGVGLMTLPTRHLLGVVAYARFARAHYRGSGVRAYAGLTVLGTLFTLVAIPAAIAWGEPPLVTWLIVGSLGASIVGFVGTGYALPAMNSLWQSDDNDEATLAALLDRFARWHTFSALWHIAAFIALVGALALRAG